MKVRKTKKMRKNLVCFMWYQMKMKEQQIPKATSQHQQKAMERQESRIERPLLVVEVSGALRLAFLLFLRFHQASVTRITKVEEPVSLGLGGKEEDLELSIVCRLAQFHQE